MKRQITIAITIYILFLLPFLLPYLYNNIFSTGCPRPHMAAKVEIAMLETAVKVYKLDCGVYPSTEQGLEILLNPLGNGKNPFRFNKRIDNDCSDKTKNEDTSSQDEIRRSYVYVGETFTDPWGNKYIYQCPGKHGDFDIVSLGKDGKIGGGGIDKDIGNWELTKDE